MGKKRPLPFVQVGEGPSRSRQRGEELEAAHTAEQARANASDARTQPPVGQRSSHSRESVQEELRAVLVVEQARGDASDDDETQPPSPEDLVQETPVSSNGRAEDLVQETPAFSNVRKKRRRTLLQRIWSLPENLKIEFGLNKRWIIDLEIIQPANKMNWAMHLLGELRRNRRTKLKKICYPKDASKEEVIGKIPEWADKQEYAALVDYWFSPTMKTLIDTKKRSRGFQKDIARSGPISFAQTADNMSEKRHKEEIELLHAQHKEQIAEALAEAKRQSDAQHKEQMAKALAEAKRQSDAQHKEQMDEMMSSMRAMLDQMTPALTLSGSLRFLEFSIIVRVDHGKSTLADKLLKLTGTINRRHGQPQYLQKLQVGICELPFHPISSKVIGGVGGMFEKVVISHIPLKFRLVILLHATS
ncbi:hypothetical protein SO802_018843 [Lithocarpus litseifolius]|uniref:Uncharacterized protein n=1 Tax=Lithocarpus litseifolius TaxID=425828 RepID=A0AAW2CRP1_9ROSI